MDQLIAHLVGDYVLQTDNVAKTKIRSSAVALQHALLYTLPFLFLTRSLIALLFICGTHFVIDRWRLAKYVWAVKERREGEEAPAPPFWLLIVIDNTMHLALNYFALEVLA